MKYIEVKLKGGTLKMPIKILSDRRIFGRTEYLVEPDQEGIKPTWRGWVKDDRIKESNDK